MVTEDFNDAACEIIFSNETQIKRTIKMIKEKPLNSHRVIEMADLSI